MGGSGEQGREKRRVKLSSRGYKKGGKGNGKRLAGRRQPGVEWKVKPARRRRGERSSHHRERRIVSRKFLGKEGGFSFVVLLLYHVLYLSGG